MSKATGKNVLIHPLETQLHSPIRLAIIRQRYTPFGGAERFVERALSALVQEGAKISLITRSWEGGNGEERGAHAGVEKIICNPSYDKILGGRAARDASFALCAIQKMTSGAFDLIQSHERIPGCSIFRAGDGVHAAWLAHRSRGKSAFFRWKDLFSSFHRYMLKQEAAMLAHPNLQAVICNSVMVREEMRHYYNVPESKLVVIENGVDLTDFHPSLVSERERQRILLGIEQESPVFLFVGNGFERKGVPTLLTALAHNLSRKYALNARLVIVGEDRHRRDYQRQAKKLGVEKQVIFTGPQHDVRPFYGMADVFVLPTRYDPMPNAALEAMACGLPIITSTTCGMASRVVSGKNGFVCDALDTQQLADHMATLSEPGTAASMREAARNAVLDLSLEAMASQLITLYHSLLQKPLRNKKTS